MFSPLNFAVDGLYPGLFSPATVGSGGAYITEVTIEPVVQVSGGGYAPWTPALRGKPDRYRVTVTVRYNGKEYKDIQIVDDLQARVYARLAGISHFIPESVMVSVNGLQIIAESVVTVKAKKL